MNTTLENLRTESSINILRTEKIFESNFLRIDKIVYTKWDDLKEYEYEQVQRVKKIDWVKKEIDKIVAALTITEDEKVILINQYRIPQGRFCIESPAWLHDKPGETLEEVARREILEETGYVPQNMYYVWRTPSSSGLTTEVIDCFIWLNCKKVTDILDLDNAEDIQVLEIPLSEIDDFMSQVRQRVDLTIDSKVDFILNEYRKLKEKK